jgi:hypothetical protein
MTMQRAISALVLLLLSTAAVPTEQREWRFKVLLDGKEVGSQIYELYEREGHTELRTKASFKIKFLFATVYRYLHENTELWDGPCLMSIDSGTDANGKDFRVTGSRQDDAFEIRTAEGAGQLPECVMTFAYWRPDFLKQRKLLNPQDGEYLDIEVSGPESVDRIVGGEAVPSQKYRLVAGELDLQLWYSLNDEWLALESTTKGNRVLQYELEQNK